MNADTRMEDARRRMELRPPVKLEYEGQLNDDPNPRAEYPRVMYKKTVTERLETMPGAEGFDDAKVKDKARVINLYEGLLCDTIIADGLTVAEALTEDGWDISPKAAYGMTSGMQSATSAKDEEIAALRALLAERDLEANQSDEAIPRRGPGRPPKVPHEG